MLFRRTTSISGSTGPASAFFTVASGKAPSAAIPPAARPELRRKLRRSIWPAAPATAARADDREDERCWVEPVRLFTSMDGSPPSKPVQRVVLLDVLGFLVAGFDPILPALLRLRARDGQRHGHRRGGAGQSNGLQEVAALHQPGALPIRSIRCHVPSSPCSLKRYALQLFVNKRRYEKSQVRSHKKPRTRNAVDGGLEGKSRRDHHLAQDANRDGCRHAGRGRICRPGSGDQ